MNCGRLWFGYVLYVVMQVYYCESWNYASYLCCYHESMQVVMIKNHEPMQVVMLLIHEPMQVVMLNHEPM